MQDLALREGQKITVTLKHGHGHGSAAKPRAGDGSSGTVFSGLLKPPLAPGSFVGTVSCSSTASASASASSVVAAAVPSVSATVNSGSSGSTNNCSGAEDEWGDFVTS